MGFQNVPNKKMTKTNDKTKHLVKILSTLNCQNVMKNLNLNSLLSLTSITFINPAKITSLDLSNCDLTEIQLNFGHLALTHLTLAHSKLKQVPACLYTGLKTLEFLDLSYNSITEFDMEPECVTNIKTIKLNNNNFNNVPKWFLMFKAINLEKFDYSMNRAIHYRYFKNSYNLHITKLEELILKNCQLRDEDFSFLRCFKQLRILDISNEADKYINTFLEPDDLFVKSKWRHINVLRMNQLSLAIFPEGIAWLESLVELYITDNNISWLPEGMEFMINLEILDVSNNILIAIPDKLLKLEFLKILKASDNSISNLLNFSEMKSLELLDLYNNFIEDIFVDIEKIKFIDLDMNCLDFNTENVTSTYNDKKKSYRQSYSLSREDGCRAPATPEYISSSSSSDDETYDDLDRKVSLQLYIEENWDEPVECSRQRNPEIDTEDENWEYEIPVVQPRKAKKIYVEDEDWMFEDVYEEL